MNTLEDKITGIIDKELLITASLLNQEDFRTLISHFNKEEFDLFRCEFRAFNLGRELNGYINEYLSEKLEENYYKNLKILNDNCEEKL